MIFRAMIAAVAAVSAGAGGGTLTTVLDRDNLPYSCQRCELPGIYTEIASLIADRMDADMTITWAEMNEEGPLSRLLHEEADLVVGAPVEPRTNEAERRVGGLVAFSTPFALAQYRVITRAAHPDLPRFEAIGLEHIGVEFGSVASHRLWDDGYIVQGRPSQEAVLESVLKGELGFGVVWNNSEWQIATDERLRAALKVQPVVPDFSGMRWNLAVAVRPGDTALLGRINAAIAALVAENAIAPVYTKYHVSYSEPITAETNTE